MVNIVNCRSAVRVKLHTNNAERKFAHSTELTDYWSVFIATIVNGEPIVWTILQSRSNLFHRTRDEVLAPIEKFKL